jgi:UDP-N-acetylglucosamine 2-epimerase (non-hydrolysing)
MHHPRKDSFCPISRVRTFAFVIGTRPEVIKMAPIVRRLRNVPWATVRIITTGQQNELLENTLAEFGLKSDVNIRHRRNCHTPAILLSQLIQRLDKFFGELQPDCVLAQGDTTTAYAASVAAFYRKVSFVHVEAGLRTGSLDAPFPEEFHRRAIAVSADLHCAPTSAAAKNLLDENIPSKKSLSRATPLLTRFWKSPQSNPRHRQIIRCCAQSW